MEQHLKQAGLIGLVDPDDPAVNDFGVPDMAAQLVAVTCPVTLARGSLDPFVREDNLAALVPDPVTLPGLGHNPHVEDPPSVGALVTAYA